MQYGVWSFYFNRLSPEETVDAFVRHGFSCSELSDEHGKMLLERGDPEKTGKALRAYAAERQFAFPQGHLKLSADICGANRTAEVAELKHWIDLYAAVGVKNAVLHPGGQNSGKTPEQLLPLRVSALRELTEYIGDRDFCICLENLFQVVNGQILPLGSTAEELLTILDEVHSSKLGICLDTGHLHVTRGQQGAFIRTVGTHLKALHIADNEGKSDQHLMPYGRGTVKWVEVMTALREIGYNGMFNLEIPGESSCPQVLQEAKLDYIHTLCEYMLHMDV